MRMLLLLCAAGVLAPAAACGDEDDGADGTVDPRISQISGLAELATYAYAAAGGEGLLDYLAADMARNCSKDEIEGALAGQAVPTGFREIKNVSFEGIEEARATVVLTTAEGEEEQEWRFVREVNEAWRILEMPSLSVEDCAAS